MLAFSVTLRRAATARAILGLDEVQSYTPVDIKKAFREKALTAHPDAGGDPESFRQLQSAYESLLREHGVGKTGNTSTSGDSANNYNGDVNDGQGFGFYAHPHAQWANDRRSHRAYWQQVHQEEMNMNTNERGSPEHPSNMHYRARPHQHTYGQGLGEAFASASQAQRGRHTNFSTYYFYRPYESDYRNPYGTGFTEEEIQQAAREQRRGLLRTVARHTFLWSGLAYIVYMHECNNRVRRATEAREKGYKDPEYWRQLREEEAEARKHNRAPLRLENHWLEEPVVLPMTPSTERDGDINKAKGTERSAEASTESKAAHDARKTQKRRQRALRPAGGALRSGGSLQVVSFQGRPFTPNGVRSARNAPPVTAKALANDVTYDVSDLDWEDETLE